jgi:hypothetical protein
VRAGERPLTVMETELDLSLKCSFTRTELQFLYGNEKFRAAMTQYSKSEFEKLVQLGVQLLLTRDYLPPSATSGS